MEDQPADADDLTDTATAGVRGRLDVWLVRGVAASVTLFIASAVFLGFALHYHLADRTRAAAKAEIARTAAAAVSTLWTYTPDTIETLPDRAGAYLGSDLNTQYRQFLEAAIAPNKQAQITDKTDVVGVAVESLKGTDSVVLVLTNTTATSPLTKNIPSLKYVAYRVSLKKQDSRWRVTKMATVSFTDLTPTI